MTINVVVITGASKGIGAELALQLADRGARLALAARNIEELEAVAAKCRAKGAKVITVKADVGVEADCKAIVDATIAACGRSRETRRPVEPEPVQQMMVERSSVPAI